MVMWSNLKFLQLEHKKIIFHKLTLKLKLTLGLIFCLSTYSAFFQDTFILQIFSRSVCHTIPATILYSGPKAAQRATYGNCVDINDPDLL